MKKIFILSFLLGICTSSSWAVSTSMIVNCENAGMEGTQAEMQNGLPAFCTQYKHYCFKGKNYPDVWAIRTCVKCQYGFGIPDERYISQYASDYRYSEVFTNIDVDYYSPSYGDKVALNCKSCSGKGGLETDYECVSDEDFKNANTGYQSKVTSTCNRASGLCEESTVYRCASGYYGSSSNGTSGCNRCPTDSKTGVTGTSSAGTTSITGCYQVKGKSFTDSTGTFEYVENCKYQN